MAAGQDLDAASAGGAPGPSLESARLHVRVVGPAQCEHVPVQLPAFAVTGRLDVKQGVFAEEVDQACAPVGVSKQLGLGVAGRAEELKDLLVCAGSQPSGDADVARKSTAQDHSRAEVGFGDREG